MAQHAQGLSAGRNYLFSRTGHLPLLRITESQLRRLQQLDFDAPCPDQRPPHRNRPLSEAGQWGGAGALVPITGFANSVAAPSIEYKKEGQVFGIGCKIFTIAGPVILYGIFTSWILGLLYWVWTLIG